MTLCKSCISVLRGGRLQTIHSTCRSFLAAVDEGCYICQGLFSQAPEQWKQKLRRHVETAEPSPGKRGKINDSEIRWTWYDNEANITGCGHGSIWLTLENLDTESSLHWEEVPTSLVQKVCPVAAGSIHWALASSSTSSEETFTKLKAWLDRCENTHEKCRLRRIETDVRWHPTRLIEVALAPEFSESANNLKCRVVEPDLEDMPQNPRYITLSHRWPQDHQGFQKLTVDKLPLWKASLPVKMLRQTFRDAFVVAQRLGISYVWIDSLCIIQDGDDYDDWRKESPMMQRVYSNAEFNICASKADQNQGLFSLRNPSSPQPQVAVLPHPEGRDNNWEDSGHYLIRKESFPELLKTWNRRMNESPLVSRGWVFQEQLLSRANVHFGDHEVLFECLEMKASESMGSEHDYDISQRRRRTSIQEYLRPSFKSHLPILAVTETASVSSSEISWLGDDGSELPRDDFNDFRLWHGLLSQYTTRQLTKFEDRLVALSGVAQHFKGVFRHDERYIAGLWRSRLATEMLWQLMNTTPREDWEKQKRTRQHLTFSWVSVEGGVENGAILHNSHETINHLADLQPIRYRMSPAATNATGGEGQPFTEDIFSFPSSPNIEIRLTGLLRPMCLQRVGLYFRQHMWQAMSGRTDRDLDLLLYLRGGYLSRTGLIRLDSDISSWELTELNTSGRLFLMPLVGLRSSVWILLLEHLETNDGKDMGRFRRIGIYEGHYDGSVDEWLAEKMPSDDSLGKLPCWRYDDLSKRHTIFVV